MQLDKARNKAKNKQNVTHTEFSDDDSEDNERNGRLPSRCNSERMSQKYDASEEQNQERLASEGNNMNLEDEECPYDAIYDLQGRAKLSTRKRKTCMQAGANKSVGPASSSSTKN